MSLITEAIPVSNIVSQVEIADTLITSLSGVRPLHRSFSMPTSEFCRMFFRVLDELANFQHDRLAT